MKSITILDTTLRDGSYAINFNFTAKKTIEISQALESANVKFIEIGHGVGLGASGSGYGSACETDEVYLEAGSKLNTAMWGMFCIPGIAEVSDIDLAAKYGMKFIRIGTDVADVESSKKYIERAKYHGMFVCANYMKSYVALPIDFAKQAKLSEEYGADVVYIVDSAGGMMPWELDNYFKAVRDVSNIELGFHGHDNLGLSVYNALHAVSIGMSIIDVSLHGMGRSSGNTPSEIFISLMDRLEISTGINKIDIMEIGEKYIKPLIKTERINSLDIISGYAQFHSSYMPIIKKYSLEYGVDPRQIIIELCKIDKVNAPENLVEQITVSLSNMDRNHLPRYLLDNMFNHPGYFGNEQS